jgi:hypothetical protein
MKTIMKYSAIALTISLLHSITALPGLAQRIEPLCYMTTNNGNLLDLTQLCSRNTVKVQPTVTSSLSITNLSLATKREFGQLRSYLSGEIVNNSNVTHIQTEVDYQIYNRLSGDPKAIENGSTSAGFMRPGSSTNFNFQVPRRFEAVVLRVKTDKAEEEKVCFTRSAEGEDLCKRLTNNANRF